MTNFQLNRRNLFFAALFLLLIIGTPLVLLNFNNLSKFNLSRFFITKPQPSPIMTERKTYQCPSVKEFCAEGNAVFKDGLYLGFGGQLPPNSPIYATFDGKLTVFTTALSSSGEDLNTLSIDGGEGMAVYYFKGDPVSEKTVKKGEIIGSSQSKIDAYNTSLIFQIIKGDPAKGEKLQLTSRDFTN